MLPTSGRLWLGPAGSFSCLCSSRSSVTAVSPRESPRGAFPRVALLAPGSSYGETGWRFLGLGAAPQRPTQPISSLSQDAGKPPPAPLPFSEGFFLEDRALSIPKRQLRVCSIRAAGSEGTSPGLLQKGGGDLWDPGTHEGWVKATTGCGLSLAPSLRNPYRALGPAQVIVPTHVHPRLYLQCF